MTVFTSLVRGGLPTSGTTFDITFGSGFGDPVAVKFLVSGGTSDGTESTRPCMSLGWTDFTRERVHAFGTEHAAAARENGWSFHSRNGVIAVPNQAGGNDGLFSIDSRITDGIRLGIDTVPALTYRYAAWAVNGDGVLAYVDDHGVLGPGLTTSITAPGFTPDAVELFGCRAYSAAPTWAVPARTSLGWTVRAPSIRSAGGGWLAVDNTLTTDVESFVASEAVGCCYHEITPAGSLLASQGFCSAYGASGFSISEFIGNNNISGFGYAALKLPGVSCWTGQILTPTGTGLVTYSEPGFEAQSVFGFATAAEVDNTLITDDSASTVCFGMAAGRGTFNEGYAAVREMDADTSAGSYQGGGRANAEFAHVLDGPATASVSTNASARTRAGFSLTYGTVLPGTCIWPVLVIGYGRTRVPKNRSTQRALLVR